MIEPGRQEGDAADVVRRAGRAFLVKAVGGGAQRGELPVEIADVEQGDLQQRLAVRQQIVEDAAAGVVRPRHAKQESGGRRHVDGADRDLRPGRDVGSSSEEETGGSVVREVAARGELAHALPIAIPRTASPNL